MPQPFDVGFTGASGLDKYPDRAAVLETIQAMNTTNYVGTWLQTTLNRADNRSWKAMSHARYARTIASAKLWVKKFVRSEGSVASRLPELAGLALRSVQARASRDLPLQSVHGPRQRGSRDGGVSPPPSPPRRA